MKRLGICIAIAALLFPSAVSTAATPCAPIEAQAWWLAPDEAAPGRHTHIATCFPTGVVSGRITFPITVKWHAQPLGATATRVRIQADGSNIWSQTSGLPVVGGVADVGVTINATIDTDRLSTGRHELRFAAATRQPDDQTQLVSSGWQLCVRSCTPRLTRSADNWTEARGWYTGGIGYENARFLTALPVGPVTGTWRPTVQCAAPSGASPSMCEVYLDPDFHHGSAGTLLYHADGAAKTTLAIDTAALATGTHKLVIRTDAQSASPRGVDSGVMVVSFTVGR
ncbi:MAG: hypothetical protein AABZ33_02010 [Chloroflexota bacterium]